MDGTAFNGVHKHRIVARGGDLVRVSEGHPAIFEDGLHGTSAGSEDDLAALAHPDRGLVGALETVYGGVRVVVGCNGNIVLACLGHPTGHGEGRRGGRDHTPGAVGGVTPITYEPGVQTDVSATSSMQRWDRYTHGSIESTALLGGTENAG